MRIVNLDTFLTLPAGTVYCHYEPINFGALHVKAGPEDPSWGNGHNFVTKCIIAEVDAVGSSEMHDMMIDAEKNGTEVPLDYGCSYGEGTHQGMKETQLFAVFNREDILGLINVLQESLEGKFTVSD